MLSNKAKRELKINQRRILIDSIEIAIPSPQQILNWGERILPNGKKVGEVKNSKTVNYKKFTPLRDGLFCERIFGPINSFVCACGKRQTSSDVTFCEKCEVEYIDKRVRRSRLGYISLVSPVVHVWYLKGRPSYLSLFLGKRKKQMLALAYCNAYLVEQAFSNIEQLPQISVKQKFKDHAQSLSKIRQLSNKFHKTKRIIYNSSFYQQDDQVNSATVLNILKSQGKTELCKSSWETKGAIISDDSQNLEGLSPQKSLNKNISFLRKNLQTNNSLLNADGSKPSVAEPCSEEQVKLPLTAQIRLKKWHQANFSNLSVNKEFTSFSQTAKLSNFPSYGFQHIPLPGLTPERSLWSSLERSSIAEAPKKKRVREGLCSETPKKVDRQIDQGHQYLKNKAKKYQIPTQKIKNVNNFTKEKLVIKNNAKEEKSILLKGISLPISASRASFWDTSFFLGEAQRASLHRRQKPTMERSSKELRSTETSFGGEANKSNLITKKYSLNFSLPSYLWYRKRYFSEDQQDGKTNYQSDFQYFLTPFSDQKIKNSISESKNPIIKDSLTTLNKYQVNSKASKSILNYFTKISLDSAGLQSSEDTESSLLLGKKSEGVISDNNLHKASVELRSKEGRIHFVAKKEDRKDKCVFLQAETPQKQIKQYNRAQSLPFLPSLICRYNVREELVTFFNSSPLERDLPIPFYCEIPRWEALYDVHKFMADQSFSTFTNADSNTIRGKFTTAFEPSGYNNVRFDSLDRPYTAKESGVRNSINGKSFGKFFPSKINSEKLFEPLINSQDPDNEKWKYSLTKSLPIATSIQTLKTNYFDSNLSYLSAISKLLQNGTLPVKFSAQNANFDHLSLIEKQGSQFKGFNRAKAKTKKVFTLSKLLNLSCQLAWQKFNVSLIKNFSVSEEFGAKLFGASLHSRSSMGFAVELRSKQKEKQNGKTQTLVSTEDIPSLPNNALNLDYSSYSPRESVGFLLTPSGGIPEGVNQKPLILNGEALEINNFDTSVYDNSVKDEKINSKYKKVTNFTRGNRSKVNLNFSILLATQIANKMPDVFRSKNIQNQLLRIFVNNFSQANGITDFELYKETEISSKILTTLLIASRFSNLPSIYFRLFYLLFTFEKRLLHNVYTPFLEKSRKKISFYPTAYQNYASINSHVVENTFSGFAEIKQSFNKVTSKNSLTSGEYNTPLSLFLILPRLKAATSSNANNVVSLAVQKFNPIFENFCQQKIETFLIPEHTSLGKGKEGFATQNLDTPFPGIPKVSFDTPEGSLWSSERSSAEAPKKKEVRGGQSSLLRKEAKGQNSNLYMFIESRGLNFGFNNNSTGINTDISRKNKTTQELISSAPRFGLVKQKKSNLNFTLMRKTNLLTKNSLNISNLQIQPSNPSSSQPWAEELAKFNALEGKLSVELRSKDFPNRNSKNEGFTSSGSLDSDGRRPSGYKTTDLESGEQENGDTLEMKRNFVSRNKISQFVLTRNILFATLVANKTSESTTLCEDIKPESESFNEKQNNLKQNLDISNNLASNIYFEGDTLASLLDEKINGTSNLSLEKEFLLNKYLKYPDALQASESKDPDGASPSESVLPPEEISEDLLGRSPDTDQPWAERQAKGETERDNSLEFRAKLRRSSTDNLLEDYKNFSKHYSNKNNNANDILNRGVWDSFTERSSSTELRSEELRSVVEELDSTDVLRSKTSPKTQLSKQGFGIQDLNASKQTEMLSHLELNTIREILAYTGGGALEAYLKRINVISFFNFLSADITTTRLTYKGKLAKIGYGNQVNRKQKRILTRLARRISVNSRRLKIIQLFMRNNRRPECMMISVLPVLPPDLRPILQMSESVVVASDINNLYQRVIYRNNRFHKLGFIDSHLVTAIQRLVQDAVDRLIENGKGASKPFYTPAGRPLKSLSDTLKGKKGRFRYNLLGKRVDFSGRSVIVVSPQLKIQECGLPKEIALELYHYFLLRQILLKKQAASIVIAKKLIKERKAPIWNMLRDIIYHHPVLLNRAPTLHRLGIQAFQPKLIDGNAIWLHPLVCSAFNADFDGDQMGVHLPLSLQARAEAWDLLWSRNNLLSPATGQPVLVPSQDMVLGFYYMTQSFASPCLHLEQNNYYDAKHDHREVQPASKLNSNTDANDTKALAVSELSLESLPSSYLGVSLLHSFDGRSKRILNVRQLSSSKQFFFDKLQVLNAFQSGQITIHTPVWLALNCDEKFEHDKAALLPLELRINTFANSTYIYSEYKRRKDESTAQLTSCIRTTAGKVLVNTFI